MRTFSSPPHRPLIAPREGPGHRPAPRPPPGGSPMTTDILERLAIDLVAIAVLAYGIYYRRHRRRDLVVIYAMFNVGLFLALVVISNGNISAGVGFGLFAVLSI